MTGGRVVTGITEVDNTIYFNVLSLASIQSFEIRQKSSSHLDFCSTSSKPDLWQVLPLSYTAVAQAYNANLFLSSRLFYLVAAYHHGGGLLFVEADLSLV